MNYTPRPKKIFITACFYLFVISMYFVVAYTIDQTIGSIGSGFLNFLGFMLKVTTVILIVHGAGRLDDKYRIDPNAHKE